MDSRDGRILGATLSWLAGVLRRYTGCDDDEVEIESG